ncbi:hypothetical protein AQUCO_09900001v1 [Aquilegia coerulea]|uniref:Uncharacterized protein n=1 Tax=Aquilegia coerulea TaxID=218851 RepID=A0A2G5C494_AQUCA|nr:hypothetical protein AQUCO_09900001v1 [Aquilegia coerulea]
MKPVESWSGEAGLKQQTQKMVLLYQRKGLSESLYMVGWIPDSCILVELWGIQLVRQVMFQDLVGERRLLELLKGLHSKLLCSVALGSVKESLGCFELRQLLAELLELLVGIISRDDSKSTIFPLLGVCLSGF